MLAVYAIVNGNQKGWTSAQTLGLLAVAAALLGVFLLHRVARQLAADAARPVPAAQRRDRERRSACSGPPRCSRGSSSRRSTSSSCSATARSRSASRSCRPTSSWASSPSRVSARLVMRFGIKPPLATGLLRRRGRARCCSRARPSTATTSIDVLPSMILLGFGAGIAFNPVLLAAMSDVEPRGGGARLGHRQHRRS